MSSSKFQKLHKAFDLPEAERDRMSDRAIIRELHYLRQQGHIIESNCGFGDYLVNWCKENNVKLFTSWVPNIPTLDELEDCVIFCSGKLYFTNKKTAIWFKLTH